MGYVNKVFLMGNLTRDPELRYTRTGTPVCGFGMAMNRNYTTQDGEKKEDVCFVDVTFWRKQAEVINEHLGKGDSVFVEGRLNLDQWDTPEGQRSKLDVQGMSFQFVGGRSDTGGQSQRGKQAPQGEPQAQQGDVDEESIPY